jgi:uncharacterized membrane protein YeaQ/YmgE (transglycosylase-associated protein family)
MSIVEFVVLLGVVTLCAIVGGALTGARYMGFVMLVALGFGGVFLARFIFSAADLPDLLPVNVLGRTIYLLAAIVGAFTISVIAGLAWRKFTA